MSAPTPSRRTRWAAAASLLILAGLVVHNVDLALENETAILEDQRPHISPRDIEHVASANPKPAVRCWLANFYYLEQRIAGKSLSLPPSFARLEWYFERVARAKVTVSPTPQLIRPKRLKELRRRIPERRIWHRGREDGENVYQSFRVLPERSAEEYVLAESLSGREIYVISRRLFGKVGLRPEEIPASYVPPKPLGGTL